MHLFKRLWIIQKYLKDYEPFFKHRLKNNNKNVCFQLFVLYDANRP